MTLLDRSDRSEDLAMWLALGCFVAYWWFMARAMRSLLHGARDLGQWFRDWRAEDQR